MKNSCASGRDSASSPRRRGSRPRNPHHRGWTPFTELSEQTRTSIHEHHGLAAIEDHAVLQVMAYRPRQHAAFDVAALADEVVRCIAMADALDVLIDDRALIEVAGDVMRGGADQLDAALVRLVIRPRALETRQKRVMDVDAAPRKLRRHLV